MSSETVVTETKVEKKLVCQYIYPRPEGFKASAERGNLVLDDPDSDMWDSGFDKAPYNGDPRGRLSIEYQTIVTEVDGTSEVVKRVAIKGGPCHKNKAREEMYAFRDLLVKGSKTPWDHHRSYRDALEAAEAAQKAENKDMLEVIKQSLLALTQAPKADVSSGSPVTKS